MGNEKVVNSGNQETEVRKDRTVEEILSDNVMAYAVERSKSAPKLSEWGSRFYSEMLSGIVASKQWASGGLNMHKMMDLAIEKAKEIDEQTPVIVGGQTVEIAKEIKRGMRGLYAELAFLHVLLELDREGEIMLMFSTQHQEFDPKDVFDRFGTADFIVMMRNEGDERVYGFQVKGYFLGDKDEDRIDLFDMTDERSLKEREDEGENENDPYAVRSVPQMVLKVEQLKRRGMSDEAQINNKQNEFAETVTQVYGGGEAHLAVVLIDREAIEGEFGVLKPQYKDQLRGKILRLIGKGDGRIKGNES